MDTITPEYWIEHCHECQELLQKEWDKIPILHSRSTTNFRPGQLVRFRGMVQDMFNPHMYFSKMEMVNLNTKQKEVVYGKYKEYPFSDMSIGDYEEIDVGNDFIVDQERRPFYCISIPGLNNWALPIEEPVPCETSGSSSEKHNENDILLDLPNSSQKRSLDGENESLTNEESNVKKQRITSPDDQISEREEEIDLYYPIDSRNNYACVVTLYDVEDGAVKLNEIIEAVGFLWFPNSALAQDNDSDEEGSIESESVHFPPLTPRLHAVHFKKISSSNPFLNSQISNKNEIISMASSLRADLHLALSQLMLGDSLAADYLICNLISSIYVRQDFLALGKLCVNFSNVPSGDEGFTEGFYSILTNLVEKSHYLPLSLTSLNNLAFLPEEDYEKNRLKSGVLQLSNNTHVVVDETKMQVGRLNERAVKNIKAINDVIEFQKLIYNFKYYEMDFSTDIPVITLSEGRSILKSDVEVIMTPIDVCISKNGVEESLEAVKKFLKEPRLTQLRQYLTITSGIEFSIPHDLLQEVIEKDYVEMRQNTELKTTVDDLHLLLVFARLLSLSHGMSSMSLEMWKKAVALETERKKRIAMRGY